MSLNINNLVLTSLAKFSLERFSMSESNKLSKQLQLLAENVNTAINNQRKYLLGRVLTIVEATTSDPEQRKATKDLLNDLFYGGSYWNDIRWHFQQISEANGYKNLFPNEPTPLTDVDPLNIYDKV